MSIKAIEAIESPLKAAITAKDSLRSIVEKIHAALPIAENAFGYDSEPATLMKDAESGLRRAAREAETAIRKLAGAIHVIDEGIEVVERTQRDFFGNGHAGDGEAEVQGAPLLIGDGNHPELELERTLPGGDAHDSFSLDRIHGAGDDGLPVLRGVFVYDGCRYVAVAMSPRHWIEACEILTPAEAADPDCPLVGGLAGQRAVIENDPFTDDEPVVLGNRRRFVVPRETEPLPEIGGDGEASGELGAEGTGEEMEAVDVIRRAA